MKSTNFGTLTQVNKWGLVNVFLVEESDGLTLIDASLKGDGKAIQQAAQRIGKPITRVLLTHGHSDHVGAIDEILALYPDAEFMLGEREARIFLDGDTSLDPGEEKYPNVGHYPTQVNAVATRRLREGDRVGSLEVYFTPGHSLGHLTFFDTRDRSAIAGDVLTSLPKLLVSGQSHWLFPLPHGGTFDNALALESARKIADLKPARLALGHGKVLEQPQELLADAIARYVQFMEKKAAKQR